ncbi:MBL fold metallo-hydrolase [Paenochrobactrum sp. BZR 588]|uniref:MBL fold metallo-hydrolase n=1 Tax=Paenochrobactrum TaxID=999488 RepID=UPI0035BC8D48
MTQRGAPWRMGSFPAGVAVFRHPLHGTVLFDSGYGALFAKATKPFPERIYRWLTPVHFKSEDNLANQLKKRGVASPNLVFLSHLHADHVAGLFDLSAIPPVITSKIAIDKLSCKRLASLQAGCPAIIRDSLSSLPLQPTEDFPVLDLKPYDLQAFGCGYDLLGDKSAIAISLPGHGFGQMGLFLPATSQGAIFLVADAIWSLASIRSNLPPPQITLKRLGNAAAFMETFAKLHAFHKTHQNVKIIASHCTESYPMQMRRRF